MHAATPRLYFPNIELKGKCLKTTKTIADNFPFFGRMAVVFVFLKYSVSFR
jgi:hypothetical protein